MAPSATTMTCKHTGRLFGDRSLCTANVEVGGSSSGSSASTSTITRAFFQVVLNSGASDDRSMAGVYVGIARPTIDHNEGQHDSDDGGGSTCGTVVCMGMGRIVVTQRTGLG